MILLNFAITTLACIADYASARQHFLVKPANQTVKQGETALLRCTIGEQAQMGQTTWTKDGGIVGIPFDYELPAYPNLRIIGDHAKGEYHLEISNVTVEDDSEYECQVQPSRNGIDALRWAAWVSVIVPPTKLELDIANKHRNSRHGLPRIVEVKAGKKLDVNCLTLGGKPAPKITWLKSTNVGFTPFSNGIINYGEDHVEQSTDLKNPISSSAHLRFEVGPADNGTVYSCKAEHSALSSEGLESNFTLIVLYPPTMPQIEGFDGRILKSGKRLKLVCTVENGNPSVTLLWYRSGVLIDRSFVINFAHTLNEYEFTVDPTDNEAEYRCEASNDAVMTPLSTAIRLKVYYPPSSVVVSGPTEGKIGHTVEFSCESSSSNPPAKITWNIDGKPYDDNQQFQIRELVSVSTVSVKLTKGMRKVNVICSAYNEHFSSSPNDRATINHQINVLYPPDSIAIYGYENKKPLTVGSRIILTCVATGGNPKAEITWYKGDKKIKDGLADASVSEVNALQPLRITVDKSDNALPYRCTAGNAASDSLLDAVVKLIVHFPPDKLTISVSPKRLVAGSVADFTCKTGPANPAPTINWRRGDARTELLQSVDVYNTSSLYGGWEVKNRLRLTMGIEDNGVRFTCQARSSAMNYTMSEDVLVVVYYKPQFSTISPQVVNVLENEPFALRSSAKANPPTSRYEWSKDGAPVGRLNADEPVLSRNIVKNSPIRSRLFVSGPALNVSWAGRRDAGEYKLTASNEEGHSSLIFQVFVSYAAVITHVTSPLYADAGTSVSLECHIDAFPKADASTVGWEPPAALRRQVDVRTSNDGAVAVVSSKRRLRKTYSDGKLYLRIDDVEDFDSGEYTCTAYNGVGGRARKTALLLVKKPPKIRLDDPAKLKAAADPGAEARLYCAADGVPQISFVWLRQSDGTEMSKADGASVSAKQTSLTGYESTLVIKRVKDEDYGFYTCAAHNSLASDSLSIYLNYTGIPDKPSRLALVNVTSSSVVLNWTPGFDGGLSQKFRLNYSLADSRNNWRNIEIPGGLKSIQIDDLLPRTKYFFKIESFNLNGASGYEQKHLVVKTLDATKTAQQNLDDEPILIIVLISLIGLVLLTLNALLIACFIKRHQRRKLLEKAMATRLSDNGGAQSRKILMYSSSNERVDDGSVSSAVDVNVGGTTTMT